MKAVLFVSSALLAIASASASAQGSITKVENGALVAANGMTVYVFDHDKPNAGTSACSGQCESFWPPYKASATDVPAGPYTIVKRDDGSPQWAYKGKPLYFFSKDMKQGDRNGDNFKDMWHVATP
ncbi:COG4315 family predicted lipoprotein [Burkholderia sp. YIM B11467]